MKFCQVLTLSLVFSIFHVFSAWAAYENRPVGARMLGMGQAFVAISDTHRAVFTNPAGLLQLKNWEGGSSYSKLFNLEELAFNVISLGGPLTKNLAFGGGFTSFGSSLYQENLLLLGMGGTPLSRVHLGFNCRLAQVRIAQESPASGVGWDGGILLDLGSQWKLGGYFKELEPAFGWERSRPSQEYGLSCRVTPNASFSSEVLLEPGFLPNWRFGQEVWLIPIFALRGGFSANPDRFSAGLGLKKSSLRLDYAVYTHEALALTHLVSLDWVIGGGI